MSKRKYFVTLRFETKEEFDKHFDSIYNPGYKQGYKEGFQAALARMIYAFNDEFDAKDIAAAENSQKRIGISRYEKRRRIEEGIKQLGVDEYLKANSVSQ